MANINKPLRILQLIDSLEPGGAEKMAVNIANSLQKNGIDSFLCATRKEGELKSEIHPMVKYLFLDRKSRFDGLALVRLVRFCDENQINVLHCHTSSIFLGLLAGLFLKKTRVIFHDHYGNQDVVQRNRYLYRLVGNFSDFIITVSGPLNNWYTRVLGLKPGKIMKLPNFVEDGVRQTKVVFDNIPQNKVNIVCVGNVRTQKDHLNLIKAFALIQNKHPGTQLHIIGDLRDQEIVDQIKKCSIEFSDKVSFWGKRTDVKDILPNMQIGVLSSRSEAFPVVLLEYGLACLPVVTTDVGDCAEIVDHGNAGIVVPPENHFRLAEALDQLISDVNLRSDLATRLNQRVQKQYSEGFVVKQLINTYLAVLAHV